MNPVLCEKTLAARKYFNLTAAFRCGIKWDKILLAASPMIGLGLRLPFRPVAIALLLGPHLLTIVAVMLVRFKYMIMKILGVVDGYHLGKESQVHTHLMSSATPFRFQGMGMCWLWVLLAARTGGGLFRSFVQFNASGRRLGRTFLVYLKTTILELLFQYRSSVTDLLYHHKIITKQQGTFKRMPSMHPIIFGIKRVTLFLAKVMELILAIQ
mmetsp:Transcript_60081/g.178145  ORF Transcript_60081/g.178145 Transcript_60081/m.178145 type:complete len:212 (+) Transcript_60081:1043-1678(+)